MWRRTSDTHGRSPHGHQADVARAGRGLFNEWLRGRTPQPEATGFFKLRENKEETPSIICVGCEQRVPLWDEMERKFASEAVRRQVEELQASLCRPFGADDLDLF